MRKVIASMNMTLDGYCDHTAGIADAELHNHFTDMLRHAGVLLYGRITYQLMEDFWPGVVRNPTGEADIDDFGKAIDAVPKIVFTRTLTSVNWNTASIATEDLTTVISNLRRQPGGDIYIGSPSLISALTAENEIDEFHLLIHPVILGKGLPLFKHIEDQKLLHLTYTKTFGSGVVVTHYSKL